MKTNGVAEIAPLSLTFALEGSELSATRPCRFAPGKEPSVPIGLDYMILPGLELHTDYRCRG
jgi:hypothetical protein